MKVLYGTALIKYIPSSDGVYTHTHTHLDFNVPRVDYLHNTHNIIKNKPQFLAVVWRESDTIY